MIISVCVTVVNKAVWLPGRKRVDRQKCSDAVTQLGVVLGDGIVPEKKKACKKAWRHNAAGKQQFGKPFSADCADLRTLYWQRHS